MRRFAPQARGVLPAAMMSAGRLVRALTCAMVIVMPEPVTSKSTWPRICALSP